VEQISNLSITAQQDGQTQTMDLTGLVITLRTGLVGETPTLRLEAANGEEQLLGATAQVLEDRVIIGFDGFSTPCALSTSMAGSMALGMAQSMLGDPQALLNLKIPAFNGVTIPKVDLISLAGMIGATPETDANGVRSATFSLPYETINTYLSILSMYKSQIPEQLLGQFGFVFDLIDNMTASNSGFALDGTVADDGTSSELLVNLYLVSDGVTSETPVGGLDLVFQENLANLSVLMYQDDQSLTIGNLSLTSDPDAAKLDFALNVLDQMNFQVNLYPDGELQIVYFGLSAPGTGMDGSLTYGPKDGGEFVEFAFQTQDTFAMSLTSQATRLDDGSKNGTLAVNWDMLNGMDSSFALTGDVSASVEDIELPGVVNADQAVDITELTEQLDEVMGKLSSYAATVQPAA